MTIQKFALHLPAGASPERRRVQAVYEAAVNTLNENAPTQALLDAVEDAHRAYGRVLLSEDRAANPERYRPAAEEAGRSAAPRDPAELRDILASAMAGSRDLDRQVWGWSNDESWPMSSKATAAFDKERGAEQGLTRATTDVGHAMRLMEQVSPGVEVDIEVRDGLVRARLDGPHSMTPNTAWFTVEMAEAVPVAEMALVLARGAVEIAVRREKEMALATENAADEGWRAEGP